MGALVQSAAPATEPVTLAEGKLHLRVDSGYTADDAFITNLLKGARELVEEFTDRRLVTQTYIWYLDRFPRRGRALYLPLAPVISLTSVVTTDYDGATAAWDSSNYIADLDSEPARIHLRSGALWPIPTAGLREIKGIATTFVVGYGAAAAVPENLKTAIKMVAGFFYENREEAVPINLNVAELPLGVQRILSIYSAWNEALNAPMHADREDR